MPVIRVPVRAPETLAAVLVATMMLLPAGGCSSEPQCRTDLQCGPNKACVNEMCLGRGVRTLALEIVPMTDSVSAPTEIANLTSDALDVSADRKTTIHGTVAQPPPEDAGLFIIHEAHVIVTIPSLIPGRNALSLPQTEMADLKFNFDLAEGRLGTAATIGFTPGSNGNSQPPFVLMPTLTASLDLAFPRHDQLTVIEGLLQDSVGQPLPDFVVRAWMGSTRVSSLAATDRSGVFSAWVPTAVLTPTSPAYLTMELVEATNVPGETTGVPQYVSLPFIPPAPPSTIGGKPGPHIYTMPAYTSPIAPTPFVVLAGDKPQSGFTVRFRAEIPSSEGTAVYQQSATSDSNGLVQVPLITEAQGAPLSYQVFLQPPTSDDQYASRCLSVPVDLSLATAPTPTPLSLDNLRKGLSGYVLGKGSSGDDVPVVGAQVTATRIFDTSACTDALPTPTSVTTDSTGYYLLVLDPGRYRLDVVPHATSPWPRLTEDGDAAVLLDKAVPQHNIILPTGEVVDGTVVDADGLGLPGAMVRVFALTCKNAACTVFDPPTLLAEVKTDTKTDAKTDAVNDGSKKVIGHFRTVLPPQ